MPDLNILVVDDSVTMRKIVVNTLKKLGYANIIEAENGKAALATMYSDIVHFIITDWNMPEMSGLEFVKAVRNDPAFNQVPILILTTRSMKDDIMAALKAGANNYIVKPFQPAVLEKKMKDLLNS